MFSYIFGYTEEVKEILNENTIKDIQKLTGERQSDEDKDLMYQSHTKNYELNKQIRRIATKIKLNKAIQNVYKEDNTYLDQDKPVHSKRIIKHHRRNDSLESVYEVLQRLSNHDKLIDETNNDMYGTNTPTPPIPIPKKNRRR